MVPPPPPFLPRVRTGPRRRLPGCARGWRRRAALVSVLALAVASPSAVSAPLPRSETAELVATSVPATPHRPVGTDEGVTLVQANIPMRLGADRFRADLAKVYAAAPDFMTFNEVHGRYDAVLAPPPEYAVHRSKESRYHQETAVAWDSTRWSKVDAGTWNISNYQRIPANWDGKLGLRFANWVTLVSPAGRQVSVVAVHMAPVVRDMPDLLRGSVTRLGALVEELAPRGPVLVGGDLNVNYPTTRYPRGLLGAAGLVPTYDTLGARLPTGDRYGATIDYLFNRGEGQLVATEQSTRELNSDHDALVGRFDWIVDAPAQTRVTHSDPAVAGEPRRRALQAVVRLVDAAQPGDRVSLVTGALSVRRAYLALRRATVRGVTLDFASGGLARTSQEARVAELVATGQALGLAGSAVACRATCRAAGRAAGMPRTLVVRTDAVGDTVARLDLDRDLGRQILERRTRVTTWLGPLGLSQGAHLAGMVF